MSFDTLAALTLFAFVGAITPGPNNIMIMASGANFGLRRSLPHALGIAVGCGIMVFLSGLGLTGLFEVFPLALTVMRGASVVYLLYLAWRLATAAAPETGSEARRPLSFLGAALFQWVNPKAWALVLVAIAAYLPQPSPAPALAAGLIFVVVSLPSVLIWAKLGEGLRHVLADRRRLRIFNATMACLLLASLWPILRG